MTVTIRALRKEEAAQFWQLAFSNPDAEWTKWNGPYFHDQLPTKADFLKTADQKWVDQPFRQVIEVDGVLVGSVTAYYEDGVLQQWLEMGIAIYQTEQWGRHIGRQALGQWIGKLFEITTLPHLGFTTWSGNERMMRLGDSLGMRQEGRIRQVRYWQGRYYDSVKYGILRNEWR